MNKHVQHGKPDQVSEYTETDLEIARELNGLPSRIIEDSVLGRKDLLARRGVVKVMAPVKHVLAVCVHVPVK